MVSVPEVLPYGFYFLLQRFKLFSFTVGHGYNSLIIVPPDVTILFTVASVAGIMIGYLIGYILKNPKD